MPSPTLSDSTVMSNFAQACVDIYRNWQRETAARRRSAIQDAMRDATRNAALPDFAFFFKEMQPQMNGHFDAQNWRLDINSLKSDTHGLTQADFISFCSVLYHEARHGEQWYRCSQGALAGELTNPWLDGTDVRPSHIATCMFIPLEIIQHAEARGTASWNKYKVELPVKSWFDSVWGVHRDHRGNVLTHIQTMYQQYLALPEEVDAWNTQFLIEGLISPLLAGVAQHVVAEAESVKSLIAQHGAAIEESKLLSAQNSLQAQLQRVKLKHVPRPESSSKVKALKDTHESMIANSTSVSTSAPIGGTGASTRVKELVAAQNALIRQTNKL